MTGLETAVVTAVAGWLVLLSFAVILVVRQLGVLTVRMEFTPRSMGDGLAIGSRVPGEVTTNVRELGDDVAYLLFLSPSCGPCLDIAPLLDTIDEPLFAFLPGHDDMAERFASIVPDSVKLVRDPEATIVGQALQVRGTPFVVATEGGGVIGKAYLQNLDDLRRMVSSYEHSDAPEFARIGVGSNGRH